MGSLREPSQSQILPSDQSRTEAARTRKPGLGANVSGDPAGHADDLVEPNMWRRFKSKIRAVLRKSDLDSEMDEEMRAHIEMRTQQNIEAGMPPEEARFVALRQFDWVESIKETCREERGVVWLEHLVQDVRYGARMLWKNPG